MNFLKLRIMMSSLVILPLIAGCAKQTSLDLGGQKIIAPVPPGFTPLGTSAPKFRAFEERILPPGVLIEYYLTDHDFHDVLNGHSNSRKRVLSITMSKDMYGRDFSEENFLGAAYFRKYVEGKTFDAGVAASNARKKIDAEKQGVSSHPALDAKWLGVFIDQHDAAGVASTSFTPINGDLTKLLSLSVTVRVKNRFIQLGCGSVINDDLEIKPFEDMCSQWAQNILKSNPDPAN